MKITFTSRNALIRPILLVLVSFSFCFAQASKFSDQNSESKKTVTRYLNKVSKIKGLENRVETISEFFLGVLYELNPTGDGPRSDLDIAQIYNLKQMDCITYIETVFALANSKNYEDFLRQTHKIRYGNKTASFQNRKHFFESEWIVNLKSLDYISADYSSIDAPTSKLEGSIDRTAWLKNINIHNINRQNPKIKNLTNFYDQSIISEPPQPFKFEYIAAKELQSAALWEKLNGLYILAFIYKPDLTDTSSPKYSYVRHAGLFLNTSNNKSIFRSASALAKPGRVYDQNIVNYLSSVVTQKDFIGISFYKIN